MGSSNGSTAFAMRKYRQGEKRKKRWKDTKLLNIGCKNGQNINRRKIFKV